MTILRPIFVFLYLLSSLAGLSAQVEDSSTDATQYHQNLYESTYLQLEIQLDRILLPDSLIHYIIDDATSLAAEGLWSDAFQLLVTAKDLLKEETASQNDNADRLAASLPDNEQWSYDPESGTIESSSLQIESGIDYSVQEFEVAFVDDDAVLREELQSPFVGMTWFQPFQLGKEKVFLNHRFRLDNQFINYALQSSLESRRSSRISRLEVESEYFHSQVPGNGNDFIDTRGRFNFVSFGSLRHRVSTDIRTRYKWYTQPDSLVGDVFSADASLSYENAWSFSNAIYIGYYPGFYQEQRSGGYQYLQHRLLTGLRYRRDARQSLEIAVEGLYNDFETRISGEQYNNRYYSLRPELSFEWALLKHFGLEFGGEYEYRQYEFSDEINPDFTEYTITAIPKIYYGEFNAFGAGAFREVRRHNTDGRVTDAFVEQADFNAYGLVVSSEYMNLGGMFLNLEYRLSWRDFPNATFSVFNSFYSNRRVQSIFAFGWIPLTDHWQLQIFANYDNDEDRDFEQNDVRNAIFNVSVVYKF